VFGVGPTLSVHPKHRVTRCDHRHRAWNFVGDDHVVHPRRNGIEAGGSLSESEREQEEKSDEEDGEKTNSHVVDLRS
jgi:hypothetical protein